MTEKEIYMSRLSKFLLIMTLVAFTLACNLISQPLNDVKDIAKTAESIATTIPIETLRALPSAIPMETLEALPSVMPDFDNYFNPQGTPVSEWNGIPIMSQATAGQEFNTTTYSFKASVTVKEVQDFYDAQMTDLGWKQPFSMPAEGEGALMIFQKDSHILTITITSVDNSTIVILTLA
jgi:hypothetical protein